MRLLPALLVLLLALPARSQDGDGLTWVEARIMFETVVDGPGPHEARAVWKAPANAPAARAIAFQAGRRFSSPIPLQFADTLFVGSGRVPAVEAIRAVRVELATGSFVVRAPRAGWEEGVAASAVFEPNDEPVVRGEARVWTDMRPDGAVLRLGLPRTLAGYITMEHPD